MFSSSLPIISALCLKNRSKCGAHKPISSPGPIFAGLGVDFLVPHINPRSTYLLLGSTHLWSLCFIPVSHCLDLRSASVLPAGSTKLPWFQRPFPSLSALSSAPLPHWSLLLSHMDHILTDFQVPTASFLRV